MKTLGIAIAGALGALARYAVGEATIRRSDSSFPWGTFIVNITGTFLLGLLFTVLAERFSAPSWLRSSLTVGFLGAYTTFSTFSLETLRLIENKAYLLAGLNSVGGVVLGLVAIYAGVLIGRAI